MAEAHQRKSSKPVQGAADDAHPAAKHSLDGYNADQPLSLVRSFTVSDFITLGNALCGTMSMFFCLNFLGNRQHPPYIWGAFVCLPFALFFDIIDGSVARWRKKSSPFGADLDSLADIVSFGVAPAVLGFTLGLRGTWDGISMCFLVMCGVSRLARYNVTHELMSDNTGKVKYYEGLPIPSTLFIVLILFFLYLGGWVLDDLPFGKFVFLNKTFHPLSLIYLFMGFGLVSRRLHVPKP